MKIDVENIIRLKTSGYVPKFLINLLKKIVHQDEINAILEKTGEKTGIEFGNAILDHFNISTSAAGLENIPKNEKLIFVSNHPLGALEALAVAKHLSTIYGDDINFIINELLSYLTPLKNIFTSVNVGSGKQNRESISQIDELFLSDKQIIIFPAGQVSRKKKGKIADGEWKKMFVTKARQYQRNVVPIFCSGKNSKFFYNLANLRKFLGIKFNIELLFLPDEMFKNKNSEINITIGKPISYRNFINSKNDLEYAQEVRKKVYSLVFKKVLPLHSMNNFLTQNPH